MTEYTLESGKKYNLCKICYHRYNKNQLMQLDDEKNLSKVGHDKKAVFKL
jgi:hypothetical protein